MAHALDVLAVSRRTSVSHEYPVERQVLQTQLEASAIDLPGESGMHCMTLQTQAPFVRILPGAGEGPCRSCHCPLTPFRILLADMQQQMKHASVHGSLAGLAIQC